MNPGNQVGLKKRVTGGVPKPFDVDLFKRIVIEVRDLDQIVETVRKLTNLSRGNAPVSMPFIVWGQLPLLSFGKALCRHRWKRICPPCMWNGSAPRDPVGAFV